VPGDFYIPGVINLCGEERTLPGSISTRGYVLENGRVAFVGTKDEILNSERVKETYMGV